MDLPPVKLTYGSNTSGSMSLDSFSHRNGGYDYQFVSNVREFWCSYCRKVMHDPVQISCGHHYCRSCLDYYLQRGVECILCHQQIDTRSVYADNYMYSRISLLEVRCSNPRCFWRGSISTIEEHIGKCTFNSANCEYCGELIEVSVLSQHKENCKKQNIRCPKCKELITAEVDQHLCSKDYVQCAFNCGAAFTRDERLTHEDPSQLNCPNMQRSCPYEKCTMRGVLSVLKDHLTRDALQHAFYYKEQVGSFQDQINSISQQQEELRVENTALKKQLLALQQGHYSNKMKLSSFIRKKLPPFPDESWDNFSEPLTISTDSILIWEIKNFKSLFNVANRYTKIYSPPFYTSSTGFKLCCYAQKDDDQIIRIYVQRMEGKFDCIQGNFELLSVDISILNRSNNLNFPFLLQQPFLERTIGPFEVSSLHNIIQFLGESTSAIIKVVVVPKESVINAI